MSDQTVTAIPELITTGDTNESVVTIPLLLREPENLVAKLSVVSGSVKFNTIGLAATGSLSVTTGNSVTVTLAGKKGANKTFNFISTGTADTFTIEI